MTKFIRKLLKLSNVLLFTLLFTGYDSFRCPPQKIGAKRSMILESVKNAAPKIKISKNYEVLDELILSNELENAFTLLSRNPMLIPSKDQSIILLNNLNILATMSGKDDVNKFYTRLQKNGVAIPSFGAMKADGPNEIDLPKFEALMNADSGYLHRATNIKATVFDSLLIPNEQGVMSSTDRSWLEIRVKAQIALLFSFVDYGYLLVNSGDSNLAFVTVAATIAVAAGLVVLESPPLFNGGLKKAIGWLRSSIYENIDEQEKKRIYRSNAATFLVSYLLGSPIQEFDLDGSKESTRKKFVFSDVPRIDIRDQVMFTFDDSKQVDISSLKKFATIHMAQCAMDAIDETGTPKISEYSKVMLAAFAQRASSPLYSKIAGEDFPSRLLPTLTRWGFVEAALIIRESSEAIDALVEVFTMGGGVGDAIAAIERTASPENAVSKRRNIRLAQQAEKRVKSSSSYTAITAVNNAKLVPTPKPEGIDSWEIEEIKGTTLITKEEILLPKDPSPQQVKTLAKEIMNMKLQADKVYLGKISQNTKKEISELYNNVTRALLQYEGTERANKGIEKDYDTPGSIGMSQDKMPNTLRDSLAVIETFSESLMKTEDREQLLSTVGISKKDLSPLQKFPLLSKNIDVIGESLIELSKLKESYWNNFYQVEALWVFRGSVYFERFTGLAGMNAVDAVWDAIGLSTRIPKEMVKEEEANVVSSKLNTNTVKELIELVQRLQTLAPTGSPISETVAISPQSPASTQPKVAKGEYMSEELKGIKMIKVPDESDFLISKDKERSHDERNKALKRARDLPLLVDLLSKPTEEENEIVGDSKGEHLTDETLKMQNEVKEPLEDNTGQVAEVINNFDVNSEMVVENKVENLMEVKVRSESEDIEVKGEIEHVVEVTNTMMLSHLGAVYNYLDHQKESIENLDVVKTKRMKELVDKLR